MESKKLVSIITPLYNGEKFIAETIESVMNQTYTNWEMIIVDNCSTDKSQKIVESYQEMTDKIRYIRLDYNSGGPARPRNIGLDNAKGDYIAFLDADDVWLPEKLNVQVAFISHNNVDIVHTLANVIDENNRNKGEFNNQRLFNKLKFFIPDSKIILFTNFININTVLMIKDSKLRFNENKYLIAIEDWLYWIENVFKNKKILLLKNYLINYRIVGNSMSDRNSDKSFRKTFYLYSFLLNESKISITYYSILSILNMVRLILRNVRKK